MHTCFQFQYVDGVRAPARMHVRSIPSKFIPTKSVNVRSTQ